MALEEAGIKLAPRKIDGTPPLLDEAGSQNKEVSGPNAIPTWWARFARAPRYTYALVSSGDPPEADWRSLDRALSHLAAVGAFARMGSKHAASPHLHLVEDEATVRHVWHTLTPSESAMALDAVYLLPIPAGFRQFSVRRDRTAG